MKKFILILILILLSSCSTSIDTTYFRTDAGMLCIAVNVDDAIIGISCDWRTHAETK